MLESRSYKALSYGWYGSLMGGRGAKKVWCMFLPPPLRHVFFQLLLSFLSSVYARWILMVGFLVQQMDLFHSAFCLGSMVISGGYVGWANGFVFTSSIAYSPPECRW